MTAAKSSPSAIARNGAKGYRETSSQFVATLVLKSTETEESVGSESLTPVFGHVSWIAVDPSRGEEEDAAEQTPKGEPIERYPQQTVYIFGGMMRQEFVRPQPPAEKMASPTQSRPGATNRFSSPIRDPRREKSKTESFEDSSSSSSPHGTLTVTNLLQSVALHSGQVSKLNPVIAPQPRYRHSCAIHPTNGYAYIFGGCGSAGYLNDLWYFSHRGESWHEVISVGEKPSPCCSHQSCFDSSGQHLYIVGGWDAHSDLLHPIHQLVLGGSTWRRIENSQITPRRSFTLFPLVPAEKSKMKNLSQGESSTSQERDKASTDLYWVGHGPLVDEPNQLLKLLPHEHRGAAAVFRRKETNAPTANAWLLRRRIRELQDRLAEIQRSHVSGVPISKINPLSTLPENQEEVTELLHAAQEQFQELQDSTSSGGGAKRTTPLLASESYALLGHGTSLLEFGGVMTSRISEKQRQELPEVSLLMYDAEDPTSTLVVSNMLQVTTLQEPLQNPDEAGNLQRSESSLHRSRSAAVLKRGDEASGEEPIDVCFNLLCSELLGLEGSSTVSLAGLSLVIGGRCTADGGINSSIFIVNTEGLLKFVREDIAPLTAPKDLPQSPTARETAVRQASSKGNSVINQQISVSATSARSLTKAITARRAQFDHRCDILFGARVQGNSKVPLQPRYPDQGRTANSPSALARRPIVRSSLRGKDQYVHELFEKSSSVALANSIARHKERLRQQEEREKELALLLAPKQVTFEEGLREYEKATEHIGIHERYRALVDQLRPYGLHRAAIVPDELLHAETQAHTEGMGVAQVRKVRPNSAEDGSVSLAEAHKWYREPKVTLAIKEATNGRLQRPPEVDYAGESATSAIRRVQEENQQSLLASAALDYGKDSAFLRELMSLTKPEHADSRIAFVGHPTDSATRFREVLDRRISKPKTVDPRPWSGGTLRASNSKPQSLLSARAIMNVAAGRCAASEKQFLSKEREANRKGQKK